MFMLKMIFMLQLTKERMPEESSYRSKLCYLVLVEYMTFPKDWKGSCIWLQVVVES